MLIVSGVSISSLAYATAYRCLLTSYLVDIMYYLVYRKMQKRFLPEVGDGVDDGVAIVQVERVVVSCELVEQAVDSRSIAAS
jgi:hypothetical protein